MVGLLAAAFEEVFYFGEEAGGFRGAFAVSLAFGFEFFEQFTLALGQALRGFDGDLDIHVAAGGAAQLGEAFAAQAELFAGLGARRDFDAGFAAVDGGDFDVAAEFGT